MMTTTTMKMDSPSRAKAPAPLTLNNKTQQQQPFVGNFLEDEFVVFPKPVKVITSPLKTKSSSFSQQQWPSTPTLVKKALFTPSTATSPLPPKSPPNVNTTFEPIVLPSVAALQQQPSTSPASCNSSPSSFNAVEFLASKEIEHILYPATLQPSDQAASHATHQQLEDLRGSTRMNLAFGFGDEEEEEEEDETMLYDEDMVFDNFECMTPPARTDNPINMDIRFRDYHFSPSADVMDCELGLFNFSPPLCSSH